MGKITYKNMLILSMILGLAGALGWYYIQPTFLSALLLGSIVGATLAGTGSFLLGWLMVDPFQKVAWKRKVHKKEYGIAYVIYKNKYLHPYVIDFSKKIIKIGNKLFHITDKKMGNESRNYDEIQITPDNVIYKNNIPVVLINYDNMEALNLSNQKDMIPSDIGSDLLMWLDDEAYKKTIKNKHMQDITFVLMVVVLLGLLVVGWFLYQNHQEVMKALQSLGKTAGHVIIQNATKVK